MTSPDDIEQAVADVLARHQTTFSKSVDTCIAIPDATRPLSFEAVLRPLLRQVDTRDSSTTVLVALGLHRPMTNEELAPVRRAIGDRRVDVIQHDAHSADLVEVGVVDDVPVFLHRQILESQRVICVGTVEPHQYAGYSGGIKALSIGCAGAQTIGAMHGLKFLRNERTTLGRVEDNPFQEALWAIASPLDEIWGLQIVPAPGGGISGVFFDEIRTAFDDACRLAARTFFEPVDEAYDWLHLPVPPEKAANFYQASRAATYAALVNRPAIKRAGTLLVEAACPEGMGRGAGERACAEAMRRGPAQLLRELRGDRQVTTRGGQQRAYVLARTCERHRVVLVGAPRIDELAAFGIEQFDTVDQARVALGLKAGEGRTVDDIFHRIPRRRLRRDGDR